jgi:hypothetical protein
MCEAAPVVAAVPFGELDSCFSISFSHSLFLSPVTEPANSEQAVSKLLVLDGSEWKWIGCATTVKHQGNLFVISAAHHAGGVDPFQQQWRIDVKSTHGGNSTPVDLTVSSSHADVDLLVFVPSHTHVILEFFELETANPRRLAAVLMLDFSPTVQEIGFRAVPGIIQAVNEKTGFADYSSFGGSCGGSVLLVNHKMVGMHVASVHESTDPGRLKSLKAVSERLSDLSGEKSSVAEFLLSSVIVSRL